MSEFLDLCDETRIYCEQVAELQTKINRLPTPIRSINFNLDLIEEYASRVFYTRCEEAAYSAPAFQDLSEDAQYKYKKVVSLVLSIMIARNGLERR
jgi:hypothetical protein